MPGGPLAEPLVRLLSVSLVYPNGTAALQGIDLVVPAAPQFISLLGPSGCGKSSLLRLVAGLEAPSAGRIAWSAGVGADRAGGAPAGLGFVFQEPTLMPWATVAENVRLPLRLAGLPRAEGQARVMAALEGVGLAAAAGQYPRELSGGMKMRVSIARALVTRPRVLLMDEPFAALDEITRIRLNNDLLALSAAQGLTVLFVTHSVYESVYLSDRIVVIGRPVVGGAGQVVADLAVPAGGPRDEAYRTSATYNQHCRTVSEALKRAMGELAGDR